MKLIGLDVGEKRIGVARADTSVKIAVPYGVMMVDGQEIINIVRLCFSQNADAVVVGMPRNLQGQLTKQSEFVKDFSDKLTTALVNNKTNSKEIRVYYQDESLTSVQARQNLSNSGYDKKAGDLDTEAATIILQDFLENLDRRINNAQSTTNTQHLSNYAADQFDTSAQIQVSLKEADDIEAKYKSKKVRKTSPKKHRLVHFLIAFTIISCISVLGAILWYRTNTLAVNDSNSCGDTEKQNASDVCKVVDFNIEQGATVSEIAEKLRQEGLIRNTLAFKIYAKIIGGSNELKYGVHKLSSSMPVGIIFSKLKETTGEASVFRFTVLPGETLNDIKKRLIETGYSAEEVNLAFSKQYDHPVLVDKPIGASLEGYLFGETYEFYKEDSVETIIKRMLDELYKVVEDNHLKLIFNALGYSLHDGITMASIIQKEAGTVSQEDQKIVSQIFWTRLTNGMLLGSDVTASYAADQADPNRVLYPDNASVLAIDSCYNTRLYAGLPCGPISNPGLEALISAANPANTSYLYFLTGDDGLMYYSYTEAEHIQNRVHCQVLCNSQL